MSQESPRRTIQQQSGSTVEMHQVLLPDRIRVLGDIEYGSDEKVCLQFRIGLAFVLFHSQ
jgi:hypothetical protein